MVAPTEEGGGIDIFCPLAASGSRCYNTHTLLSKQHFLINVSSLLLRLPFSLLQHQEWLSSRISPLWLVWRFGHRWVWPPGISRTVRNPLNFDPKHRNIPLPCHCFVDYSIPHSVCFFKHTSSSPSPQRVVWRQCAYWPLREPASTPGPAVCVWDCTAGLVHTGSLDGGGFGRAEEHLRATATVDQPPGQGPSSGWVSCTCWFVSWCRGRADRLLIRSAVDLWPRCWTPG